MSSPSTLTRRARAAEAAGKTKTAKRLRAEAAALRRKLRKTPLTRKIEGYVGRKLPPPDPVPTGPAKVWPVAIQPAIENRHLKDADFAVVLTTMVERERASAAETARHKTAMEMSKHFDTAIKDQADIHHIQIVSAFMATIEAIQRDRPGSNNLPPTVIVSGMEASHIYRALRQAGFTREGKGGVDRETIRKPEGQMAWKAVNRNEAFERAKVVE